jgi:hypothetical protein
MLKITLLDRSLYFKGLLLLIRKDAKVTGPEVQLMRRIGAILGFEAGFCDNAIGEILGNRHIVDQPPVFSTPEIARHFLMDGITVGWCDHDIPPSETAWLQAVEAANGLDFAAVHQEWEREVRSVDPRPLKAAGLTV